MPKPMPFDFLLDYLPANVIVKPAIGMFYIYFEKKIMLIFRKTGKNTRYNGIWICTRKEKHESLMNEIPAITKFEFDEGEGFDTNWLQLNEEHEDFEAAAISICELVAKRDKRIGKATPKSKLL